ncbi:MAG TPA: chorismate synthase [Candidatus Hydrogenedentes bacterium]|nr:chorismate synthase [Candidatus Hydrogenedentota bacterium]HQE82516.1 chorismate synthase [Candidatus Hydrogenedentota bacterium]HQH51079.1 chorismate synthase [Candidatus Hydrogenedentota bacterium]HQM47679.1 chorismate synthase [Candidatus Hydrogenedentota bacterium]
MLRYYSAGESHGRGIFCLLDGFPAGLHIRADDINFWLAERQKGYGRGGRQRIEKDEVDVLAGIRGGVTLGSPVLLAVWNRDFKNWESAMDPWNPPSGERAKKVVCPRPSHADLAGALKYEHDDCRNVLERASARETAARVAAGAVCRKLLAEFGIDMVGHVVQIGEAAANTDGIPSGELRERSMASDVRCAEPEAAARMRDAIKQAKRDKDSLGGVVEVRAWGLPVGLGSHTQAERKLDGAIAQALMSIQAVKGVEVGIGFRGAHLRGSRYHDEIVRSNTPKGGSYYVRTSNNLGGTEGGMTSGEELLVRIVKKPISTLMRPLRSVNIETKLADKALVERSDTCAVPALALIAEHAIAIVLAQFFIQQFGGDSVAQMKRSYDAYMAALSQR